MPLLSARSSRPGLFALALGMLGPSAAHAVCGDGALEVTEACDDGNTADNDGCSPTCQVEPNSECASVNLFGSVIDSFPDTVHGCTSTWSIDGDARGAFSSSNCAPAVLATEFEAQFGEIVMEMEVQTTSDDDWMGLVFGYQPGANTSPAEWLLLSWKQSTQNVGGGGTGQIGMRLSRVLDTGVPDGDDFWDLGGP